MTGFLAAILFGMVCFIAGAIMGASANERVIVKHCEKMGMFRSHEKVFKCERLEAGDVVCVPGRNKEGGTKNLGGSRYVYRSEQPTWEE